MRDVNGVETVVNKPLSFPLTVGKNWNVKFTEQHPNKVHRSETWDVTYKVVGNESIEVPAGKFTAVKIEAEGKWAAQMEPSSTVVQAAQTSAAGASTGSEIKNVTATTASGRIYKAFWYVPEVKRWVKSVEELYSSGGVRSERSTTELESFKAAN